MKLSAHKDIDILVIEDVFTEKEQSAIWNELSMIVKNNILLPPDQTGSARYENGSIKKKNSAIFLDELYTGYGRNISPIIKCTENLLLQESKDEFQKANNFFGMMKKANLHFTLVNYYENSDHYDFHDDDCAFTILSYIFKEPKKFSGGNITFKENEDAEEIEIEVRNNMSIVFPSFYQHKVDRVIMEREDMNKMLGRFSISQFLYISAVA